jgi:hypothetical protein
MVRLLGRLAEIAVVLDAREIASPSSSNRQRARVPRLLGARLVAAPRRQLRLRRGARDLVAVVADRRSSRPAPGHLAGAFGCIRMPAGCGRDASLIGRPPRRLLERRAPAARARDVAGAQVERGGVISARA